ncbi:unnamed protein product [Pleuronectes platessa]|uniref:Uncharacterized protein n=1 Tax=Pleuronectes platessa TaxID=8262 RepID=A0A9N7V7D2_PLEPL|nr:unnamed protein product [Pleuronectes platessa]
MPNLRQLLRTCYLCQQCAFSAHHISHRSVSIWEPQRWHLPWRFSSVCEIHVRGLPQGLESIHSPPYDVTQQFVLRRKRRSLLCLPKTKGRQREKETSLTKEVREAQTRNRKRQDETLGALRGHQQLCNPDMFVSLKAGGRFWLLPRPHAATSKRPGMGWRGTGCRGRPARLLLPWALGAGELGLELRLAGMDGKRGEVEQGWVCSQEVKGVPNMDGMGVHHLTHRESGVQLGRSHRLHHVSITSPPREGTSGLFPSGSRTPDSRESCCIYPAPTHGMWEMKWRRTRGRADIFTTRGPGDEGRRERGLPFLRVTSRALLKVKTTVRPLVTFSLRGNIPPPVLNLQDSNDYFRSGPFNLARLGSARLDSGVRHT